MKKILFLGPKPPPVTGYSNIVNELSKCLNIAGATVKYISTVPSFLSKFFPSLIWKISRLIYLICLLPIIIILIPFHSIIYINANGGLAQIGDIVFGLFGRIFLKRIILHHNSYSYLNKVMFVTKILFFVSGKNAIHIVNCEDMKEKLSSKYNIASNIYVISNVSILTMANNKYFSVNLDVEDKCQIAPNVLKIGFMGYFNKEKGLELFSFVVKQMDILKKGSVQGIAVGPVHDEKLSERLKLEFEGLIDFRAPVYGEQRDAFFNEIDVLLFPSSYLNEAEPLTIHHALSAGVPVISTDIGCLKETVALFRNSYSFPVESYLDDTLEVLDELLTISQESKLDIKRDLINCYQQYSFDSIVHLKKILQNKLELEEYEY